MQTVWQDLTLAVRLLRKRPTFAVAAIVTLALGIGANATVFSLADAELFRTLPVPNSDRIVQIYQRRAQPGRFPLSYADYLEYHRSARSFEALAAHYPTAPLHLLLDGEPVSATGAVVTASYFDVLKLRPAVGRFFAADEDQVRDRDAVAVVSEEFWSRHYARQPSVVGATVQLNGRTFTIIGVAPRGFSGVYPRGIRTDVWIPSAMFTVGYRYCDAFAPGCDIVEMIGMLRSGVGIRDVQAELDVIARRLEITQPATNKGRGVRVAAGRGLNRESGPAARREITILLAVVTLVLMIACANIAGLLLARGVGRRGEFAVRLALGASRRRLVQQLLTEALLLAVLGGAAGLLVATWGNTALDALYARDSAGRPVDFHLTLNASVLAATAALTTVAALLFGLMPSLAASRPDVITALKDERPAAGSPGAALRRLLVAGQLAVSVILLIGAGLLIQSARNLYRGPGFDPAQIVLLRLRPSLVGYAHDRAHAYQRAVIERIESLPGVLSASPGSYLTVIGVGEDVAVSLAGAVEPASEDMRAVAGHVGARYFSTLGIALIEGRDFTGSDTANAPRATIINNVLAKKLWPDGRAVGQSIRLDGVPHTVVGVVPDARYYAAGETPQPQVFYSYWQSDRSDAFLRDSRMHVRVTGEAAAMLPTLRRAIAGVDPNVPISEDYPLLERIGHIYQPVRIARIAFTCFAAVALVLSSVGLYGVLSMMVAYRTREIGIRLALGATAQQVSWMVVRDAVGMTVGGISLGVVAAGLAAGYLRSLLYGIAPADPVTFIAAPAALLAIAGIAALVPARRASRVNPLDALCRR